MLLNNNLCFTTSNIDTKMTKIKMYNFSLKNDLRHKAYRMSFFGDK